VLGLAKNDRLVARIADDLARAERTSRRTGKPARRFQSFMYQTRRSWSRRRRVVGKAEFTEGETNPRFVVTSLNRRECKSKNLYEKLYCARGEMENRIKECQLDLYADRTSTATLKANQLRLWFASMAYVLLCGLRRIGLGQTKYSDATCGTLRLAFLKIGARVAPLTRAARSRHKRAIIRRPTEIKSSLPPRSPDLPTSSAPLGATRSCCSKNAATQRAKPLD